MDKDTEDVVKFKEGDREAGNRVFIKMKGWVYPLVRKACGSNKDRAEEIYAAIQIDILEAILETYDPTKAKLITFLYPRVKSWIRRESEKDFRHHQVPRSQHVEALANETYEDDHYYEDLEEFHGLVLDILDEFSEVAREVIKRKNNGMTDKRVARDLKIQPHQVSEIMHGAKVHILKELQARDVDWEKFIGGQDDVVRGI